jgi:uncharacterized protein (TIGR03437 family)
MPISTSTWNCLTNIARASALLLGFFIFTFSTMAQESRITRQIDNSRRLTLTGHLHPQARPESDQGRVSPSLELSYVTLALTQTDAQKADLAQLLKDQQTAGSPNFHRWLTPEQYGQRFGVSEDDLNQIKTWLQMHGLTVVAVARGHNSIAFSGSAAQVEAAFQTQLHHFLVNGETHFANSTEPSIPAAFGGVVTGVHGLNDFRLRPAKIRQVHPDFTSSRGNHYLAPNDFATIYNVRTLYNAGFDGTGQKLVIAGQTQVDLTDIDTFRSSFNLPANDPQIVFVPNTRDPGVSSGDVAEADLDLEWSGAVARNATIIYVYTFDVMQSIQYAIDQNLAPVISSSYGSCEPETPSSDATLFRSWAQQGNAQGITWFSASGDNGGADCGDSQNSGLSVDTPASIPEVTGIGGTEFADGGGQFWNSTNDANGASALSYIPETTWNDSIADGVPSSGGGGASIFFQKPSWQTGVGVPADNARHVPDISLTASADHDGYLVYTGGQQQVYGGTSAPTPSFAGVAVLLNQYLVAKGIQSSSGLGNMNPNLYSLAQTNPDVFHDVATGDNIVTVSCPKRLRTCTNPTVGYAAGAGYDQATGLGSVDAYKLVTEWNGSASVPVSPSAVISLLANLNTLAITDVVYLTATVQSSGGVTPAGTVTFDAGSALLGSAPLVGSAGTARATLAVKGSQLPLGSGTITAAYTGVSNNSTASVTVSVTSSGSTSSGTPAISAGVDAASYQSAVAPGGIMAVFGAQMAPSPQSAGTVPLPISMAGVAVLVNGVAAPLYYVSSGLVNIQIPYETVPNSTAVLSVNNNGKVSTQSFAVAAAAPGIFMDQNRVLVPTGSATRGQEIALYITGAGAVSPPVATGAAPLSSTAVANLPQPTQTATVTVGNVHANIVFIGTPPGLVGVTQINFQVPSGINVGAQPVIVSIGSILSAAVTLNVTN